MKKTYQFLALLLVILIAVPQDMFATFGAASAWDVQSSTGSDTNGGAFDSGVGSPGTNESVGSGTAISITLTGTTTGTGSPVFSSTTHGPGNFIHIASGSGCSTGWYEELSQSSGTATFDHAMGTSTNVCVGTIGGSLATIANALTLNVASNTIWLKGTFTITTVLAPPAASGVGLSVIGYTTTHGDGGQATIATSTNTIDIFDTASTTLQQTFQNLIIANTAATPGNAFQQITSTGNAWRFSNMNISGTADGINADNSGSHFQMSIISVFNSQIACKGGSGGTGRGVAQEGNALVVIATKVSGCLTGLSAFSSNFIQMSVLNTVLTGNGTGAKVYGNSYFTNDDFESNVTGGIVSGSGAIYVNGSIFYGNGRAIDNTSGPITAALGGTPNAYGNNTSANINYIQNSTDITTLSVSPWVGGGNYALNTTAGGGALLKGASFPGVTGYIGTGGADIGAIQSVASGGSGGSGNSGSIH